MGCALEIAQIHALASAPLPLPDGTRSFVYFPRREGSGVRRLLKDDFPVVINQEESNSLLDKNALPDPVQRKRPSTLQTAVVPGEPRPPRPLPLIPSPSAVGGLCPTRGGSLSRGFRERSPHGGIPSGGARQHGPGHGACSGRPPAYGASLIRGTKARTFSRSHRGRAFHPCVPL